MRLPSLGKEVMPGAEVITMVESRICTLVWSDLPRCLAMGLLVANAGCTDHPSVVSNATEAGTGGHGAGGEGGAAGGAAGMQLVGLRRAAREAGKLIGTAVRAEALADDPAYAEVLAREFDYVTPENATKWGVLQPVPTRYRWEDADAIVAFAEEHSQAVKGHAFVWHRQMPNWVTVSMSPEDLSAAIRSHIETTLDRYRGRIRAWDVVNEAVDTSSESGYTESLFWTKLGPSYIEDAFRWAREADADVHLFYNEVGIERLGRKSDFTYELMRDLLSRGVPIDGIGFQSHLSTHRYPPESDLRANIRRFADLGLSVNISELDARTLWVPGDQAIRWESQRLAFQQVVGACVVEPGCEAITFWGFTDLYSWINDDAEEPDDPLIFDRDYAPKPAYDGVLAGFVGELPTLGDNLVANGDFAAADESWAAVGGALTVDAAVDRDGSAACVSGRTVETDGLVQSGLLEQLSTGGTFSLSAWVRLAGATDISVNAALTVQEEGQELRYLNVARVRASDSAWTALVGDFTLGFNATPTAIDLVFDGPPADVEICVAGVRLQPVLVP